MGAELQRQQCACCGIAAAPSSQGEVPTKPQIEDALPNMKLVTARPVLAEEADQPDPVAIAIAAEEAAKAAQRQQQEDAQMKRIQETFDAQQKRLKKAASAAVKVRAKLAASEGTWGALKAEVDTQKMIWQDCSTARGAHKQETIRKLSSLLESALGNTSVYSTGAKAPLELVLQQSEEAGGFMSVPMTEAVQNAITAVDQVPPRKRLAEILEACSKPDYPKLIQAVYTRHNPEKLNEVDSMIAKFAGKEDTLYLKVCQKYKVLPDVAVEKVADKAASGDDPLALLAAAQLLDPKLEKSVQDLFACHGAPSMAGPVAGA
eukprot:gnl/TRDRNA2_/TRDRNA2_199834_c0_seq1.p1 gnl/TRDRNA2_/TRDRNA2_199834_c0~~gnl/TRDRNA2_/TRDRNA2_199834_c0_seq1.p1  ORF type:complete len:319 (-),score=74.36 gnl/TRDRNA2_/TRDRNA2_199834_c0_seq1:88-1044(-)